MALKRPLVLYGGYVGELPSTDLVHPLSLGTGTRTGLNFLRDDGVWAPTVTALSFTSANGVIGTVTSTESSSSLSITLGDISPTSVVSGALSSTVTLSTPAVVITQFGTGNALEVYGRSVLSGKVSVTGPLLIGNAIDNGIDKVQVGGSFAVSGASNLNGTTTINNTVALYSSYGTVLSTSTTVIDSFSTVLYRSAKYQVQISDGVNFETLELFIIHDGVNVHMTSYGNVFTSPTSLGYFDAAMATNSISVTFTANTATNKTIKFLRSTITI